MEEEKIENTENMENTENVCEVKQEKKCSCKKIKCIFRVVVLVLLIVITALAININANLSLLMNATGLKAQAQAVQAQQKASNFLISKKYDKGQSFKKALKTGKPIIAWFYVDWCGYCKRFAPIFDELTKDTQIRDKYAIAFINCEDTRNAKLIEEYKIQGYPSVFLVNPKTNEKVQLDNNLLFAQGALDTVKEQMLKWAK